MSWNMKLQKEDNYFLSDGQQAIIRWHSPDPIAASKFPNQHQVQDGLHR